MTDWPKLIRELEGAGLGVNKIALIVECQYTQIKRLKERGAEPRHSLGVKLLEVHDTYIRNTRSDIPTN
jgi:hypothetical protein